MGKRIGLLPSYYTDQRMSILFFRNISSPSSSSDFLLSLSLVVNASNTINFTGPGLAGDKTVIALINNYNLLISI